jgi:hypothetical protein
VADGLDRRALTEIAWRSQPRSERGEMVGEHLRSAML